MKLSLVLLLGALCAGPLLAQTAPAPAATPAPKKKLPAFQRKYDANGDGVLDAEERAKMKADKAGKRAERLKKYDADGDGKLSRPEKEKMKADRDAEKAAKKAAGAEKRAKKKAEKAAKKEAASTAPTPAPTR